MDQKKTVIEAERLDRAVQHLFTLSHAKAVQAVATGKVSMNGKQTLDGGVLVTPGSELELRWATPRPEKTNTFGASQVYLDEDLIVINKPAGLLAAPAPNSDDPSALLAAQRMCKGPRRPKVVHRLDLDTSGLLVFARSVQVARSLSEMLEKHEIQRTYLAVVQGTPEIPRGLCSSMLLGASDRAKRRSRPGSFKVRPLPCRDPGPMPGHGQLAITRYELLAQAQGRSLLSIRLGTGRTHQIRIHMAELGCPLVGEHVYAKVPGAPRQALHAARLAFKHPTSGEFLMFKAPWPEDLAVLLPDFKDVVEAF